jgi:ribonuclease HII
MPGPIRTRCPTINRELRLLRRGFVRIAGLDEAGRGAWAGPLAAGAVILPPPDRSLARVLGGVRDSKMLSPRQRSAAAQTIRSVALAWAVGSASAEEVDRLGPHGATRLAMVRALDGLGQSPDHLLIDHFPLPESRLPQTCVTHGDALCLSIAAASVLAKVWRDERMAALDLEYPGYGFLRHKGYGTREHSARIARLGVCAEHRRSYAPIREALETAPV